MEWAVVDTAPEGCFACKTTTGPFLIGTAGGFSLTTIALGTIRTPAQLCFCLKTEQREGCFGAAARAAGYIAEDEADNLRESARQALERTAELELQVSELEQRGLEVVPVQDLLDTIHGKSEKRRPRSAAA